MMVGHHRPACVVLLLVAVGLSRNSSAQQSERPRSAIEFSLVPTLWTAFRSEATKGAVQPVTAHSRVGWSVGLEYSKQLKASWTIRARYERVFMPVHFTVGIPASASKHLNGVDHNATYAPWTLAGGRFIKRRPFLFPYWASHLSLGAERTVKSYDDRSFSVGVSLGVIEIAGGGGSLISGHTVAGDSFAWIGRATVEVAPSSEYFPTVSGRLIWTMWNRSMNSWRFGVTATAIIGNWWSGNYIYFEGTPDELRGRLERSPLHFGLHIGYAWSWGAPKEPRWVRKARENGLPIE